MSESYICRIVEKMKAKNSSGIDGISNALLKSIISVIKSPLCMVVNKSLQDW